MGSYSILTIERVASAWKYEVPAFLTFLFKDDDFYSAIPEDPQNGDEYKRWVGYRTTVAEARTRLNELGFTRAFFGGMYETLVDDIDKSLIEPLAEHLGPLGEDAQEGDDDTWHAAEAAAIEYLRQAAEMPIAEQLDVFTDELRKALAADSPPRFIVADRARFQPRGGELMIDAEGMSRSMLDMANPVHPAALRVAELFAEWSGCPIEIRELFLARVLLDIASDEGEVDLDLTDLWDDDLTGEPSRLAAQLVRRVQLYNRAFSVLIEHEGDVRRRAALVRIRELLDDLPRAATNQHKGRLLEDLIATIFEVDPAFIVAERRYDLGDQEIDLVIRNHVDNPFWAALNSPLILVECKNWSAPVGTREIRDFETKLRDDPIARLGFFISVNGFSSEVSTALHGARREPYRLIVLAGEDIEQLVYEGLDVIEWLTRKISKLT